MGGGAADDRQKRVVPRLGAILDHRRQGMASLPIPDELMAEILLRLPVPADLVRAAAACVSFRRVAAHRAFLRQYRKLHAPPFIGFLDECRLAFLPVFPTHPCAPAASAAVLAADLRTAPDFSFSFLPAPARDWRCKDSRDGRVLAERRDVLLGFAFDRRFAFGEMVVCDPVRRWYLLLPPVPDDLAASALASECSSRAFLAPPDNEEDEASFRVMCMVESKSKLFACVFCSSTKQWRTVPSQSWSDLLPGTVNMPISLMLPLFSRYAYGCFYWMAVSMDKIMLVLDIQRMEFSIAELPPEPKDLEFLDMTMVEVGDGITEMFVLARDTTNFSCTIRRYSGGSSSQWKSDKISLGCGYVLGGSVGKYLLLYWFASPVIEPCHFTLDIKTFQLEKVCAASFGTLYTYSNFPPLFSSPTISSGVENRAEKDMLEHGCGASSGAESSQSETQNSADADAGGQAKG